ncbi:MAG: sterol desaturase family protein [Prosthecobacter sp.]
MNTENYAVWGSLVLGSVVYATALEYVIHRWMMHFPGMGKNDIWRAHAIEHHGHGRNDINIALPVWMVLVPSSPLFAGCFLVGGWWAVYVLVSCVGYAALWTALHSAYHEVGHRWIARGWYYRKWRSHHMAHHDHPRKNFGAIFIWSDWIAGTHVAGSTNES